MEASLGQPEGLIACTGLSGTCLVKGYPYSPSHVGTVSGQSVLLCWYPGTVRIIWAAHTGVHQAFQDNALAAVPEIPHLHSPDEYTLEIVFTLRAASIGAAPVVCKLHSRRARLSGSH